MRKIYQLFDDQMMNEFINFNKKKFIYRTKYQIKPLEILNY